MIKSKFDPVKHGLPYKNGSFNVGTVGWTVLCGGLSYTALDYFETGIRPPKLGKTPADGSPMAEYLYRRQLTAHFYTWHRFLNAWSLTQLPIVSIFGVQDSLKDLCQYLVSRPVILCLFAGPGTGHHVVASACDPGKKEILLYDSNHPGKTSVLTLTAKGDWLHSVSNYKWTGWFMDWGHYTDGTKMPPLAFRYCRRCHGLNTSSLGVQGVCVNGGGHDNHTGLEYFLPWKKGEGRAGWKVCGKCQSLYRQAKPNDVPFCLAGGMHLPQQNNSNWQELRVMTGGQGEAGWRRCSTCTSLVWGKNKDYGKCVTGDSHVPESGESYVVDHRTI